MAVTNPELLRAMENIAKKDSPENRKALYAALTTSELLVPIAKPLPGGNTTGLQQLIGTADVEFVVAQNKQGQNAFFAFTDEDALKLWKSECAFIATNALDLFAMALEMNLASIILNVAGPTARGEVMRWEFQALATGGGQVGTTIITPPPDAPVKFSALAKKPTDKFMNGLRDALARHPEIAAGYLMQAQIGDAAPHLVAGVQFTNEFAEDVVRHIIDDLGDKLSTFLVEGEFIDFIVIDNELNVPVAPASEALVFKR
jgi:hypothetical protein